MAQQRFAASVKRRLRRLWRGRVRPLVVSIVERVPGAAAPLRRFVAVLRERDLARAERDDALLLQREHARLWARSRRSDGGHLGALKEFFPAGRFSYSVFEQRLSQLQQLDDPYQLGAAAVERLGHVAGPVRFGRAHGTGPPDQTVAFATVCTDKFTPGLEALVLSLLDQYPAMESDFWVFHDGGLTDFSQRRLLGLYSGFRFARRDTRPYAEAAKGRSPNQRRIGALGYLSLEALKLSEYERVILLDSDLLVVGDVSPLWADATLDDVRVVPDAGVVPVATLSEETGAVVFNSGVISLPRCVLGPDEYAKALDALPAMQHVTCPTLQRYADQKFWNVYLNRCEVTYLPANYNANKQLLERYWPDHFADASIIHYTSAKPWYSISNDDVVTDDERSQARRAERQFSVSFRIWNATHGALLGEQRVQAFSGLMAGYLDEIRDSMSGKHAALVGNGPSLARTDLSVLEGRVLIAFNWFVNHEAFDDVAVDHLMVMSHMFFGGWQTVSPAFPPAFLERLTSRAHRPVLWFPFYFRPVIEATPELEGYEVRYLLLEKPFKTFAEELGYLKVDLYDFLSDARTGVMTAGLPLALHLGCDDVVLVGCDASYGASRSGGDYFYAASQHTSKSTATSSLHTAWAAGGAAQECFRLGAAAANGAGAVLHDATIDGLLTTVPKVEIPGLRR